MDREAGHSSADRGGVHLRSRPPFRLGIYWANANYWNNGAMVVFGARDLP